MAESQSRQSQNKSERDVREDLDALRSDMDALRDDVSRLIQTLGSKASAKARSEAEQVRERVESLVDDVERRGREEFQRIEGQVEARPMTSLAMAFAIGLIFGRMFDRR